MEFSNWPEVYVLLRFLCTIFDRVGFIILVGFRGVRDLAQGHRACMQQDGRDQVSLPPVPGPVCCTLLPPKGCWLSPRLPFSLDGGGSPA